MTTPTLLPCPNPGCGGDIHLDWEPGEGAAPIHQAECWKCWMVGPEAPTREEAATLWNSLPRTPEVEWLPEGEVPKFAGVYLATNQWGAAYACLLQWDPKEQVAHGLGQRFDRSAFRRWSSEPVPVRMPPAPGEES